jgi:FkbM family methyltransferase
VASAGKTISKSQAIFRMNKLAFIIATKDRLHDLRKMLISLQGQSVQPDQIVIVDGGSQSVRDVAGEFASLNISYTQHSPPSAAGQRNAGLSAIAADVELIGFLDDDVVLQSDAIEKMLTFWETAGDDVGGAGFNWLNPPRRWLMALKRNRFVSWLDIYAARPGGVARSGWQSVVGTVDQNTQVQWLPSGAVVWRRDVFKNGGFDGFFQGYSYLEDLDFSYDISRQRRLFIVADAGFSHYPATAGRIGKYQFGKTEVANRLHIVRKHQLSRWRCCVGLLIRFFMTLAQGDFARAAGNVAGLARRFRPAQIFKSVCYHHGLVAAARAAGLSDPLRRMYYRCARPSDGILSLKLEQHQARFRVHTAEELRLLESMGGGETQVMREVLSRLPHGSVVFDVGANVGLYTTFLAKAVGSAGQVVAFEPQPSNHAHLVENVQLNELSNVTIVRKALGESSGNGNLWRGKIIGNYSLVGSAAATSDEVEIVAGDAFAFSQRLAVPHLIKIDVEGFEMSVVRGLYATLRNPACRLICIEVHPYLLPKSTTPHQVIAALEGASFEQIWRQDRKRDFHLIMAKPEKICLAA